MFGYASSHHILIYLLSLLYFNVFHAMSISIRNEILPRLGQCVVSLRDTFQGLQKKCSWKDGRTADGVVDAVAVVPHKKIQKGDIFPRRLNNSGLG